MILTLRQRVRLQKPDEEISTGTTVSNNSADSPEWLCKYADKDYWDMPAACQRAKNEDPDFHLDQLFKKEGNAKAITAVDSPMTPMAIPFMDSPVGGKSDPNTLALRESASATTKPTKDSQSDDDKPIVIETREPKIPEFKDASVGDDLGVAPTPKVENTELTKRFEDAWKELDKLLNIKKCAKLFGGFKKAKKILKETTFKFDALGGPKSVEDSGSVAATTDDKTVIINTQGSFASKNLKLKGSEDGKEIEQGVYYYAGEKLTGLGFSTDAQLAGFVLIHELGHRSKAFDKKYDIDGGNEEAQAKNNTKIFDACYKALIEEASKSKK
jgi:hypothetical protein